MKRPIIVLTGGGTAGHVSVNEALIPEFLEKGYDVHYIGSHDGIEKDLIQEGHPEVTYHAIQSGKLRRYFSFQNFTDPLKVGIGVLQALKLLHQLRPEIVFSKGGFVAVPVVFAASLLKIPTVIHESDVTPGLANKLSLPFAKHIFTVFDETLKHVPTSKATCTGPVIRPQLFDGDRKEGLRISRLSGDKPVVIIMGGSQGAVPINRAVREDLPTILKKFEVIHLCGKGNVDDSFEHIQGYTQFEYVTDGLPHLLAAADLAVSRAGSNAIFELLALQKPMLLIPLSAANSRGDQLLNAKLFKELGIAQVLSEETLASQRLSASLQLLLSEKTRLMDKMIEHSNTKTPAMMMELILSYKN